MNGRFFKVLFVVWVIAALQSAQAETARPQTLDEWSLVATAVECGIYKNTFEKPMFDPSGVPSKALTAFVETKIKRPFDPKKDRGKLEDAAYKNPACELFIINALGTLDPGKAKDRCEEIRDPLYITKNFKPEAKSLKPTFSLDSFSISGVAHQDEGPVAGDCDELDGESEAQVFACFTEKFRGRASSPKKDIDAVMVLCTKLGVNMNDVKEKTRKAVEQTVSEKGKHH
jgi:hypothetical protein